MSRSAAWVLIGLTLAWPLTPMARGAPPRIQLNRSATGFLTPEGQPFHPRGFNYDRDHRGRLLEEYWEQEWNTVESDFAEMKRLGANTIRIHLQAGAFLNGPTEPNPRALERLRRLLRVAERTALCVDLTGLGCYRKTAVPAWYNALDEAGRWKAQTTFWRAVARAARDSRAVWCYNLMNEPFVPGTPRPQGDWLAGEFGGFSYVQAITLDPAGRPRTAIARQWIRTMATAIRNEDPQALITVGLLPERQPQNSFSGFDPEMVARELDFISVHLYPDERRPDEALEVLAACDRGRPLVVEEIFPLHISPERLTRFISRHSDRVTGWLTFYWGQPPEELAQERTLAAAVLHDWLVRWQMLKSHSGR